MRLFAALSLPDVIVQRLSALQAGLPGGRIVPPENLHLTLGFFGDCEGARVDDLHHALDHIRVPAFDLWLDGIAGFGSPSLRQVYAAVQPHAGLDDLHTKIITAARATGIDVPRRRFIPHVTLARLSPATGRADERWRKWIMAGAGLLAGPIAISHYQLYRSDLSPTGPRYTELAQYSLTTSA